MTGQGRAGLPGGEDEGLVPLPVAAFPWSSHAHALLVRLGKAGGAGYGLGIAATGRVPEREIALVKLQRGTIQRSSSLIGDRPPSDVLSLRGCFFGADHTFDVALWEI